jgi:hypothetical protein
MRLLSLCLHYLDSIGLDGTLPCFWFGALSRPTPTKGYMGRARDHVADTHRFLNLGTGLIIISRGVIWLNKVYGDYAGIHQRNQTRHDWMDPG